MLTVQAAARYKAFVQNYDAVRRGEQWGAHNGAYYRALPYRDLSGQHPDIWRIRTRSYDALVEEIVRPLSRSRSRPLKILDAGAGNGWLSYRLALEGHMLLATDLRVDEVDGLGACSWYRDEVSFVAAQATFEQLPLCSDQLDLVIFNGSIHYASKYHEPLREALRVLTHDGNIVIVDSPLYEQARSGQAMVRERHHYLKREHNIDPKTLPHEDFLTHERLDRLAEQLTVQWRLIEPLYGWAWKLAPWLARLRGKREPARFYLIVGGRCS